VLLCFENIPGGERLNAAVSVNTDMLLSGDPDIPPLRVIAVRDRDGTRFANDGTGHGMFIGSDQNVNPF
jgi:hypothetical protein